MLLLLQLLQQLPPPPLLQLLLLLPLLVLPWLLCLMLGTLVTYIRITGLTSLACVGTVLSP